MSVQSFFVKEVHLSTIEKMIKQGKKPEQVIYHLKSVWCDDNQIKELLNEAHRNDRENARNDEIDTN